MKIYIILFAVAALLFNSFTIACTPSFSTTSSTSHKPLLEKMGLVIKGYSYRGFGELLDEKKYFKISKDRGNTCGPYTTYVYREAVYIIGGLLLFFILFLIKVNKARKPKRELFAKENSQL